jgi:hypothetical protein
VSRIGDRAPQAVRLETYGKHDVNRARFMHYLHFAVSVVIFLKRRTDSMKACCLSDISPIRTHTRGDFSPG